jgi:exonuclease III
MDNPNNNRQWKIRCWNVTGINSQHKLTAIKSKILETSCDIICLQEIKNDFFYQNIIKKFYPSSFDYFEFIPLIGASGGTIIVWKSS